MAKLSPTKRPMYAPPEPINAGKPRSKFSNKDGNMATQDKMCETGRTQLD